MTELLEVVLRRDKYFEVLMSPLMPALKLERGLHHKYMSSSKSIRVSATRQTARICMYIKMHAWKVVIVNMVYLRSAGGFAE